MRFAAAPLTDNALAWWDKDVAEDIKYTLRKRYMTPYYHKELKKKFRKLVQGSKSVEEYFEEFEIYKKRLGIEESDETLMAQFFDGLNDCIGKKVERQSYHNLK